jgi:hypothetical protein
MAFLYRMIFLTAGVLALFVSLILYLRFSRDDARGERSLAWPTTNGHITQSRLDVREHRTQSAEYVDLIDYEYTVGGRPFHGQTVDLQVRNVNDRAAMQAFVDSYTAGQEVSVHYDPQDPSRALLIPGVAPGTSGPRLLLSKILLAVGLLLIIVPLWLGRTKAP